MLPTGGRWGQARPLAVRRSREPWSGSVVVRGGEPVGDQAEADPQHPDVLAEALRRDLLEHGEGVGGGAVDGLCAGFVAEPLLQAGVEEPPVAMRVGRSRALTGCRTGSFRLRDADSQAGEEPAQLVEIDPPGLDGRGVGGIETAVNQPDEGLGRKLQLRELGVLPGCGRRERDRLAGLQREVPLRVARRHVQPQLGPVRLAAPRRQRAERVPFWKCRGG